MRLMKKIILLSIVLISIGLLAGCSSTSGSPTTEPTSAVRLTPYFTATQIPTATATPANAPTATPLPTSTPTPKIYVVKEKDTLVVIAYKNGLTVEELKAANPDVDPYMMKVGTELIIPFPSGATVVPVEPTATAYPLTIGAPYCLPSVTGGLYCFGMVENDTQVPVQNISAVFTLTDNKTGDVVQQAALFPMTSLYGDSSLPLYTYFPPAVPADYQVELTLQAAAPAQSADAGIVVHEPQINLAVDGLSVVVSGEGVLTESAEQAKQVAFTFVAIDADRQVVGIRRTQTEIDLSKGSSIPYSVNVYSISGKIVQVLVYAETLP